MNQELFNEVQKYYMLDMEDKDAMEIRIDIHSDTINKHASDSDDLSQDIWEIMDRIRNDHFPSIQLGEIHWGHNRSRNVYEFRIEVSLSDYNVYTSKCLLCGAVNQVPTRNEYICREHTQEEYNDYLATEHYT